MLDPNLTATLKTHLEKVTRPVELVAVARRRPEVDRPHRSSWSRSPRCPTRSPSSDAIDDDAPPVVRHQPGRHRRVGPLRRHPAGPRVHVARARPPPGRRPPVDGIGRRRSARSRSSTATTLRDLLLAVVPELPRRGAGAQPHERPQPEDLPRRHRRRPVPGRGRRARRHGRPVRASSTASPSTRDA